MNQGNRHARFQGPSAFWEPQSRLNRKSNETQSHKIPCAAPKLRNTLRVNLPLASPPALDRRLAGWRRDAARLAAELLCEVSPAAADEVLDLRSALLDGTVGAEGVLKVFFLAKNRLETEHYLLFYRLRRVLEPALALSVQLPGEAVPFRHPLDFRCRDLAHLRRSVQRECFEHHLTVGEPEAVKVEAVWRF